jgi:hypothetical protein
MPQWRAIQVSTGHELAAARQIAKLGHQSFCLWCHRRSHRKGSPLVAVAYFPGYCFADADEQRFPDLLKVKGVQRILKGRPIPHSIIQELIARADIRGCISAPPLIGCWYRFKARGALARLQARIERIDKPRKTYVFIHLLGLDVPAIVSLDQIDTNEIVAAPVL